VQKKHQDLQTVPYGMLMHHICVGWAFKVVLVKWGVAPYAIFFQRHLYGKIFNSPSNLEAQTKETNPNGFTCFKQPIDMLRNFIIYFFSFEHWNNKNGRFYSKTKMIFMLGRLC